MGGNFTVALGALAALGLFAACGGQSIRHGDGDSGAGGEGNAGTSGSTGARDPGSSKGGSTSTGGTASSSGGTGAPDKPPPLVGGATGAGATSGTGSSMGGGTSPNGGTLARGGSGATSAAGGSSGGIAVGCADPTRIPLSPDETGWIHAETLCDSIGVQGGWFVFGDALGDATCLDPGGHLSSECARITTPDPSEAFFPNLSGAMHTAGVVEKILPCPPGLTTAGCPENDYANMWGAGIGFDLNHAPPTDIGTTRNVWNAAQVLATGIEFTLQAQTLPGLRVEFPMALTDAECDAAWPPLPHGSTTDDHPAGAPYWGAQSRGDGLYPPSPVVPGVNLIQWDEVQPPKLGSYTFDRSRLLGVRFHVPTSSGTSATFDFAISNVAVHRSLPLD